MATKQTLGYSQTSPEQNDPAVYYVTVQAAVHIQSTNMQSFKHSIKESVKTQTDWLKLGLPALVRCGNLLG